jgi:hypothetical protein
LPGITWCSALIADDPATAVPPLKWIPCASGRSGCTQAVVDWGSGSTSRFSFADPDPVRLIGGKAYLNYFRQGEGLDVLQLLDGSTYPFDEPRTRVAREITLGC